MPDEGRRAAIRSANRAGRAVIVHAGLSAALLIACIGGPAVAQATGPGGLPGHWVDTTVGGPQVGALQISPGTIQLKQVGYAVSAGRPFAGGTLFRVKRMTGTQDPLGCGPASRVGSIVVHPLPAGKGPNRQSIQILFHGGRGTPKAATLWDDPLVCSVHVFERTD